MTMTLQDPPIASSAADLLPGSVIELGELNHDQEGRRLIASRDLHGALLVIDQDQRGRDRRLVARLAPEEPEGNALLVAELYRADPRRHARPLTDDDWFAGPSSATPPDPGAALLAPDGRRLRLGVSDGELRWLEGDQPVSLRRVLAAVESYDPVAMSARALELKPSGVRSGTLREELRRNAASPFVLNRGLREAVQARLAAGETLALIAGRCGRCICGDPGRADTSWLARRCGLMPPPNEPHATPWVHTDVLALIAREGLGVAPREVELA
jgi:hypothetical protein